MVKNKGKTFSDWDKKAKQRKLSLDEYLTKKEDDLLRIERAGLPHFDLLTITASEFFRGAEEVRGYFISHVRGGWLFCVRALPNSQGVERGYTRVPRKDIPNFRQAIKFLREVINPGEESFWNVGVTNMGIQPYGGVIRIGGRYIQAEIGRELDKLTSGEETPLVALTFDRENRGEPQIIFNTDEGADAGGRAELFLLKSINIVRHRKGYFEFVVDKRKVDGREREEIYFLDYKPEGAYTARLQEES